MIKHALSVGFHSILLWLDAMVYEFVTVMYRIFLLLADANIFTEEFYQSFSQRIYVILGVVMLFVLAYALLKAMVDPDQLTKGDKGIAKIVPTFVTSLVLCGILPSIFNFAYQLQTFILQESNTIGILILGPGRNFDTDAKKFGVDLARDTLFTFIDTRNTVHFGYYTLENINNEINNNQNFLPIVSMADAIADDDVTYRWGFSTAVGIFLIYVLATFCLDLAARAVRFAFLQLIAPVPILMRVMPMKNDIFKNWVKKTIACYTEIFVRVLIMYLVVFFIGNVQLDFIKNQGFVGAIANVLIIMGIFMFAKEAPKLLSEVTGIDSGNIKLGIKDFMGKLGAGGAFVAGGLLGGGIATGIRNFTNGINDKRGIFGTARSTLGGLFSGAARGGKAGWGAKNFADMAKAAGTGAKGATDARDQRAAYRAAHGGTFKGAMAGHASDTLKKAKQWVGLDGNPAQDSRIKEGMTATQKAISNIQDVWKSTEGWKKADENATIARGQVIRYAGSQNAWEQFDKIIDQEKQRYLDAAKAAGLDSEQSLRDWNNYYNANAADIAKGFGISDVANFLSARASFQDADATVKGIERAVQSQANKQSQLQSALQMLGMNMDKYADMRSQVMSKLSSEDASFLNSIDLANINVEQMASGDLDRLYDMMGKLKGGTADAIAAVEKREVTRKQVSEKK